MKPFRVSNILGTCGMVDTWWFQPEHQERGRAVHWLLEAVLRGEEVQPGEQYAGYVKGIRAALAALPLVPVQVETRLTANGTTGRPDVVGFFTKPVGYFPAGPVIIDGKTGIPMPVHRAQLAFYEMLAEANGLRDLMPPEQRRLPWTLLGLYVDAKGGHRLKTYGGPEDREVMHAALTLTRWRVANGLLDAEALAVKDETELVAPPVEDVEGK